MVENRRPDIIPSDLRRFRALTYIAHGLGMTSVVLVGIWMGAYGSGYNWKGSPDGAFRYHPLLMVMAMQLLLGEALMVYRIFRDKSKEVTKPIHIALHTVVFALVVVGLKAAFDSHNYNSPPIPNMYSLHSWIGMTVVVLFTLQYVFGFAAFYYPKLSEPLRRTLMPAHRVLGMALFVSSTATVFMGLTERAAWHVKCWSTFCTEGLLVNFAGLLLVAYACVVIYLVSSNKYKKEPLVESPGYDEMLAQ